MVAGDTEQGGVGREVDAVHRGRLVGGGDCEYYLDFGDDDNRAQNFYSAVVV